MNVIKNHIEAAKRKLAFVKGNAGAIATSRNLVNDDTAKGAVGIIIGILVVFLLIGALLGTAMSSYHSLNTTNWTTSEIAVSAVFGIFALLSILFAIMPDDMKGSI